MPGKGDENEIEKSHFRVQHLEIDGLKKSSKNVNRTAVRKDNSFVFIRVIREIRDSR
jgi:hypothetical protein